MTLGSYWVSGLPYVKDVWAAKGYLLALIGDFKYPDISHWTFTISFTGFKDTSGELLQCSELSIVLRDSELPSSAHECLERILQSLSLHLRAPIHCFIEVNLYRSNAKRISQNEKSLLSLLTTWPLKALHCASAFVHVLCWEEYGLTYSLA